MAEAFTGTPGKYVKLEDTVKPLQRVASGVLANHAGLVTGLAAGTLKVRHVGGKEDRWQVAGGFFEVSDNNATVLADSVSGGPAA